MDKHSLNNCLVIMRKHIAQARIHIMSKLTREIKKLRKKSGDEQQKEKNSLKADKLTKEVLLTKTSTPNEISKYVLLFPGDPLKMMGLVSSEERVKLRFAANKVVANYVEKFRAEHPDWALKLPVLFVQLGFQYQHNLKSKTHKVKNKKQQNLSDIQEHSGPEENKESVLSENMIEHGLSHDTEKKIEGELDSKELVHVINKADEDPDTAELFIDSLSTDKLSSGVVEKVMDLANQRKAVTIQKREQEKKNCSNRSANSEKEQQKIFPKTKARIGEVRRFSDYLKATENEPENTEDSEKVSSSDENSDGTKDPFFLSERQSEQSSSSDEEEKSKPKPPKIINGVTVNRKLRRMLLKANSGHLNLKRVRNKNLVDRFKTVKGYKTYGIDNLHPSWAAKKKEREIVPFQGKKIKFDDN